MNDIKLGMTRQEVINILGEPDHKGGTSRKYKTPMIYKYGDIELHFEPYKRGTLCLIWDELNERTIAKR